MLLAGKTLAQAAQAVGVARQPSCSMEPVHERAETPTVRDERQLRTWLTSVAQGEQIVVSVDHPTDWEFFVYLARDPETLEMPPHIKGQSIRGCVDPRDIEAYWSKHGRHAHHALHDAHAIKYAFDAACSRDGRPLKFSALNR